MNIVHFVVKVLRHKKLKGNKKLARRNDHSREELKQITLESCLKIVEKQGIVGLTARRIATEIGYTPGTLYNIFGSMEGLYYEINAATMQKLSEELFEATDKKKPPIEQIEEITDSYIGFALKNRQLWLMLFNTPFEHEPPDWYAEKIENLFHPLEAVFAEIFKGREKKKIKLAARTFWAAVHGIAYLEITQKGPMRKNRMISKEMAAELIERFFS